MTPRKERSSLSRVQRDSKQHTHSKRYSGWIQVETQNLQNATAPAGRTNAIAEAVTMKGIGLIIFRRCWQCLR